jgi:threonine synthase
VVRYRCDCGGLLEVDHSSVLEWPSKETMESRRGSRLAHDRSGVWRYREWVLPLPLDAIVTKPEGNTGAYCSEKLMEYTGANWLVVKHEGENPTGSFKDRGMVAGTSAAKWMGLKAVACASTGNTSASMASYAAQAGMTAFVFIPRTGVASGKLAQAIAYGAHVIQLEGDFDDAMDLVQKVAFERGIYLLNSINPFRIEGQKAIAYELLDDLAWQVPDWIVVPGGNLGNSTAISKGLRELHARGIIDRLPRIAVIQASGANPLFTAFNGDRTLRPVKADTIATAIKIGNPVSFDKCLDALDALHGVVIEVTDQEILDAKAMVDSSGIGAEPASCASIAGLKKLIASGTIGPDERTCAILTGHVLKDPDVVTDYHQNGIPGITPAFPNRPVVCGTRIEDVLRVVDHSMKHSVSS